MAREPELYKDKIEVSLDGRQIFYLFFGGAVIVGLVFVLGVMVGRRLEARGHVERAHVEATLDPLAALDRLEGGGLAFQGTLRGSAVKPPAVDETIDELAKARQAAARPADKKPEAVAKPELVAKPEAKPDRKPDPEPEVADKKPDKPRFTLQLSSLQDKAEAEALVQSIRTSGFQAYLTQGDVDGKQFYRVRVGSYRTIDAANDAKAELEKTAKKTALVTRL
ncbi:MAG TPA: SPOR domain-containing protein [Kofleriaceae bacterium]|nr:SPOR domain-containing protein [Kofleriaceae bacterium]